MTKTLAFLALAFLAPLGLWADTATATPTTTPTWSPTLTATPSNTHIRTMTFTRTRTRTATQTRTPFVPATNTFTLTFTFSPTPTWTPTTSPTPTVWNSRTSTFTRTPLVQSPTITSVASAATATITPTNTPTTIPTAIPTPVRTLEYSLLGTKVNIAEGRGTSISNPLFVSVTSGDINLTIGASVSVSVISGVSGISVSAKQGSPWTVSGSVSVVGGAVPISIIAGAAGVSVSANTFVNGTLASVTNPLNVIPGDGTGTYESIIGPTGHRYQGVAMVQDVHASTLNAYSGTLTTGASYTGLTESTLAIAGIQVSAYANATLTVRVDQSIDGTNWDKQDIWTSWASDLTNSARTVQATGSYFRVALLNTGGQTATVRMGVALCPVVEALPPSLSANGNLKVQIREFKDRGDKVDASITVTGTGETIVLPAGGDRIYTDLSMIVLSNQSATETVARIKDSLAGTVRFGVDLAPNGGGAVIPFGTALFPQAVSNTPWTIELLTTPAGGGGLVRCTLLGFKVK